MRVVTKAWQSYRNKLSRIMEDEGVTDVMKRMMEESTTLDEFSRMVFTEGFAAGEKHGKTVIFREGERRYRIN